MLKEARELYPSREVPEPIPFPPAGTVDVYQQLLQFNKFGDKSSDSLRGGLWSGKVAGPQSDTGAANMKQKILTLLYFFFCYLPSLAITVISRL
ncbi:hypothetical protein TURU_020740 [Turdus rufiventris]|nr:hypothetical protein TURU_020740 [Turdus rufiventris]